jgi:hypothetical protein
MDDADDKLWTQIVKDLRYLKILALKAEHGDMAADKEGRRLLEQMQIKHTFTRALEREEDGPGDA